MASKARTDPEVSPRQPSAAAPAANLYTAEELDEAKEPERIKQVQIDGLVSCY